MIRRCIWLLLAVILFSIGTVVRSMAAADGNALQAAARKEGEVTWYVGSLNPHSAKLAGATFTKQFGPKVNVVSAPSPVIFQRLTQSLSQNAPNADVFSSIDVGNFVTLKQQGALAAYRPKDAGDLLPAFRHFDKDATFQATVASMIVVAYNKKRIDAAQAPQSWADLTDPEWKGKISLGAPSFSVYSANWAMQMDKLYGKPFLRDLARVHPRILRSSYDCMKLVASGEALVTVAPKVSILESADRGDPLAVQYPSDGAILIATPSAVLKSAPHPNAARLFMDFLLGPAFGRILVQAHYEPNRSDVVPAQRTAAPNLIRPTVAEMTKDLPKIRKLWSHIFRQ